ncbi:hypothetical protein DENSPDRAFT_101624 [Dentipellis sp. KUC8613]|nr:hypothetical protein DENSPDRAFT_101624 [Dentipellis sp. KUC8613]
MVWSCPCFGCLVRACVVGVCSSACIVSVSDLLGVGVAMAAVVVFAFAFALGFGCGCGWPWDSLSFRFRIFIPYTQYTSRCINRTRFEALKVRYYLWRVVCIFLFVHVTILWSSCTNTIRNACDCHHSSGQAHPVRPHTVLTSH